jgi:hypothetical protein
MLFEHLARGAAGRYADARRPGWPRRPGCTTAAPAGTPRGAELRLTRAGYRIHGRALGQGDAVEGRGGPYDAHTALGWERGKGFQNLL